MHQYLLYRLSHHRRFQSHHRSTSISNRYSQEIKVANHFAQVVRSARRILRALPNP